MQKKKTYFINRQQETTATGKSIKEIWRIRQRRHRENLTNEGKEKVKQYDRNRKRESRSSGDVFCKEENVSNSVSKNGKVTSEINEGKKENTFMKSAKEFVDESLGSPSKKDFLVEYFKSQGLSVNIEGVKKKKFSVLQLKSFKLQNRAADHRELVQRIVDHYGSLLKASKDLNQHYSTFYNLCQPIKQKVHRNSEKRMHNEAVIQEFFDMKSTTTSFPQARLCKKQFMNTTYEEGYFKYVDWCKDKGYPAVSNKTFHRLKPDNVYKLADTPENQCTCILCQNFKKDRQCIEKYGIKGVAKHTNEIILQSMCSVTDADLKEGVFREFGNYDCISRNCCNCGYKKKGSKVVRSDYYEKKIKEANPGIYKDKTIIEWQRWETFTRTSKKGTEIKRPDKVDKSGTYKQFLEQFLQDVHDMSLHLFNWKWHDKQFQFVKDNLDIGTLLMVLDFAQNYMNVHADEPQGCHWDHTQTVIHPIVIYRKCPVDGKIITEEHIMISDDLRHDKYAVKKFEEVSVSNLKNNENFEPCCIVQFCDNCSSQYKSKGPFQYISTSGVPTMRSYFGANHGKGPSDAATGRVKKALTQGRKSRKVELRTAFEVYQFIKKTFQRYEEDWRKRNGEKCNHFRQKVFFVTDIDRSDPIEAVTTKSSKKFSTIRSTGEDYIVEARNVACCCPGCMFQDCAACPNKHYAGEWKQFNLLTGKRVNDEVVSHWDNCNLVQNSSSIGNCSLNANEEDTPTNSICRTFERCERVSNTTSLSHSVSNTTQFNWNDVYMQLQSAADYNELSQIVSNLDLPELRSFPAKLNRIHEIDDIALQHLPTDAPKDYLPVKVYGDGNCCPRAICLALGLDPSENHKEMRIRICKEGVSNKNRYLNNSYLNSGCVNTYTRTTFPIIYAEMSEYRRSFGCIQGESIASRLIRWSAIAAQVYKKETFMVRRSGEWMGMWQLFQAANAIKRPICSVYPNWLAKQLRDDLNRTIVPFENIHREKEPIYIMWTSTAPDHNTPNHFVPLLK